MLLAGDVGGTKTILGLYELGADGLRSVAEGVFQSSNYHSLGSILRAFLKSERPAKIDAACFGVAGPVVDGVCEATNLPWRIEAEKLAESAGCGGVSLLNDLEATGLGILRLPEEQLVELNPDAENSKAGNIAVIAAGTGLGEAILFWDGHRYFPIATEGGHCDFAPNDEREEALLRYLRGRFGGHVSYERIVSGPGLHNIYRFLRDSEFAAVLVDPEALGGDPSPAISRLALERQDPLCVEALRLFTRIYGAEAGNLALKCLSAGGVRVGGGIAPKILPALQDGQFMSGFLDKGRFRGMLRKMSVKVALHPKAALLGAAYHAQTESNGAIRHG